MNKIEFGAFVKSVVKQLLNMYENKKDLRFSMKTSPTEFEKLVVEASEIVISKNSRYACSIEYVGGGHAFPIMTIYMTI